jgi:hypothetical protein
MTQLIYTCSQFSGAHVARQALSAELHSSLKQDVVSTHRLYQKFS